jgi:hypothetical protein
LHKSTHEEVEACYEILEGFLDRENIIATKCKHRGVKADEEFEFQSVFEKIWLFFVGEVLTWHP